MSDGVDGVRSSGDVSSSGQRCHGLSHPQIHAQVQPRLLGLVITLLVTLLDDFLIRWFEFHDFYLFYVDCYLIEVLLLKAMIKIKHSPLFSGSYVLVFLQILLGPRPKLLSV